MFLGYFLKYGSWFLEKPYLFWFQDARADAFLCTLWSFKLDSVHLTF